KSSHRNFNMSTTKAAPNEPETKSQATKNTEAESSLPKPSASYSQTLRLKINNIPGMLGKVTSLIGDLGGDIGAIDIAGFEKGYIVRDITVNLRDGQHSENLVEKLNQLDGCEVVHVSDRTFLMHLGGKIRVTNKVPLATRDDLSMAYTPGVARICT